MAIALDQQSLGTVSEDASDTTIALTTNQPVASNGYIDLVIRAGNVSIATVVDNGPGLTWTQVNTEISLNDSRIWRYRAYAPTGMASGTIITVTFATATDYKLMGASSFIGVESTNPENVKNTRTSVGDTTWNGAPVTTTVVDTLVLALAETDGVGTPTNTPGAGWSELLDFSSVAQVSLTTIYKIVSGTGPQQPNGAWSASQVDAAQAYLTVALKAAILGNVDTGTIVLKLTPSANESLGASADSATVVFKFTPSGVDEFTAFTPPASTPSLPSPYISPIKEVKEWRIIHLNHALEELGECFPSNPSFQLPLSAVGDVSYEISFNDPMATWTKTFPYVTDYLLMFGDKRLQAGIHTGVSINDVEAETLQISGNDYLHYLERRWFPFDPLNLAAGGYTAPINTDLFVIIEHLLDQTLSLSDSLALIYNLGLSGQTINDFKIDLGDTESILAKIETLSKKLPGFDYEIDTYREFRAYPDGKGTIKSFTFEQGRNIQMLDYANRGPAGTHTLGIVQGQGNKISRARNHPGMATYRRLDIHEELSLVTTDTVVVQSATDAESERNIAPQLEFSARYIEEDWVNVFDEVETGDRCMVHADLGWSEVHDYMRIVNIAGTPDDEGNYELTFTFDDGTLAQ